MNKRESDSSEKIAAKNLRKNSFMFLTGSDFPRFVPSDTVLFPRLTLSDSDIIIVYNSTRLLPRRLKHFFLNSSNIVLIVSMLIVPDDRPRPRRSCLDGTDNRK